jgi:archaellin
MIFNHEKQIKNSMNQIAKKGLTSLDALILFIAILLVTAIVAISLTSIINNMQQKTLTQASQTQKHIGPAFEIVSVYGTDPSLTGTPHRITDIFVMIRGVPGTNIDLNGTFIQVDIGDSSQMLRYNSTCFSSCPAINSSTYMVYYPKAGTEHKADYVTLGETLQVAIKLETPLGEDEDVRISFIPPSHRTITKVDFVTPQVMNIKWLALWPLRN